MKNFTNVLISRWWQAIMLIVIISGCQKDEYYVDGGLANPLFDGSLIEYLESKPVEFDSLVQVIRIAGLEETFQNEEFTFFAPHDGSIKSLIGALDRGGLNRRLYNEGKDTVMTLSDIDPIIWKKWNTLFEIKMIGR